MNDPLASYSNVSRENREVADVDEGSSVTYTLKLDTEPTANVTVMLSVEPSDAGCYGDLAVDVYAGELRHDSECDRYGN